MNKQSIEEGYRPRILEATINDMVVIDLLGVPNESNFQNSAKIFAAGYCLRICSFYITVQAAGFYKTPFQVDYHT